MISRQLYLLTMCLSNVYKFSRFAKFILLLSSFFSMDGALAISFLVRIVLLSTVQKHNSIIHAFFYTQILNSFPLPLMFGHKKAHIFHRQMKISLYLTVKFLKNFISICHQMINKICIFLTRVLKILSNIKYLF